MEIRKSAKSFLTGLGDGLNLFYNPFKLDPSSIIREEYTDTYRAGLFTGSMVPVSCGLLALYNPIFFIGFIPTLYKSVRWVSTKE
jgi:hypothetical protein